MTVFVLIATTAEKKRENQLSRAIESVLSQEGCEFELVLVINGQQYDEEIRNRLENDSRFSSVYKKEGSYPKALMDGRSLVNKPYFCILDDDDELLPGSLSKRLAVFTDNPQFDVVVSNGIRNIYDEKTVICVPDITDNQDAPLEKLLKPNGNWLGSCAGMYKTSSVTPDYFEDYAVYGEWTYLAVKLALFNKIYFLDEVCFKINMQKESLSHSVEYIYGLYEMLLRIKKLPLPPKARQLLNVKISSFEHSLAVKYLENDRIRSSWKYHCKSISKLNGFCKYVLFSRYYVKALF